MRTFSLTRLFGVSQSTWWGGITVDVELEEFGLDSVGVCAEDRVRLMSSAVMTTVEGGVVVL